METCTRQTALGRPEEIFVRALIRGARRECGFAEGQNFFMGRDGCEILTRMHTKAGEPMAAGETERHRELKRLALAWAQANGFGACACEVRVPKSGYRADVAACGRRSDGGGGEVTAVFECKQARADWLKDAHEEAATCARLAELRARRSGLEALLREHHPELRRGEALWPEFDAWDFAALRHEGYRMLLKEIATVQRRVREGTMFSRMARYRCADFLYVVVEDGIFARAEIPLGWGLLVRCGEALEVARPALALKAAEAQRAALRRSVGLAQARPYPLPDGVRGWRQEEGELAW